MLRVFTIRGRDVWLRQMVVFFTMRRTVTGMRTNRPLVTVAAAALCGLTLAGCSSSTSSTPTPDVSVSLEPAPGVTVAPENEQFCADILQLMTDGQQTGVLDATAVEAVTRQAPENLAPLLPGYFAKFNEFITTGDPTLAESPEVTQTAEVLSATCG